MIICGIDPGSRATGYGLIDIQAGSGSSLKYLSHGTIVPETKTLTLRLKDIFTELTLVLETFRPEEVAVETSFHYKNAQTALKLGQARGCLILAASLLDIPVFEYAPTEIKKAVCGYGQADKEQVSRMVTTILHPPSPISSRDATDALAICICHSSSRKMRSLAI